MVENEGNARLTTSAPKIHIAVAGIEKVIPRAQDLATFLKLLARSATGQLLTVYTSFLSGPRRAGEIDGPEEFYVVLLDNGRTKLLPDRAKRQSLYCIRCGACLNTLPGVPQDRRAQFSVGLFGTDRRDHHAAIHGRVARAGAAVRLQPVRRVRRSLPGEDRHPEDPAGTAREVKKTETRRRAEPAGETGLPRVRLADDASAHLRDGGKDGGIDRAGERWRLDPERAGTDERGSVKAWLSQRDLPPSPAQKFPRDVEAALMSRDNILHGAHGAGPQRGAGGGRPAAGAPARAGSCRWKTRIALDAGRG